MNLYVFGPNPHYWSEGDSRGNGVWRIQAADADEAMQMLLPGILFPGELAGRAGHMFVPGISIEGEPEEHVIQVWSDDPACIARTIAAVKGLDVLDRHGKPIGDVLIPCERGLEKEIRVIDLPNLLAVWGRRLALPAPEGDPEQGVVSPLGRELGRAFSPQQRQVTAFQQLKPQMELLAKQSELEEASTKLEGQLAQIKEQNEIHKAYQAGGASRRVIASGERAPMGTPYWIFPERLFLDEEVALLMNLEDMDFRDMEALYDWLAEGARWKKLLPQEKCILVTRLRGRPKQYADPIVGHYYNLLNMEHLVWVRDGEFCAALGCDIELNDPLLPSMDFVGETMRTLQEKVWQKHFKALDLPKPGIKKDALWETSPYEMKIDPGLHRYKEMVDWLNSPDYSEEVKEAIAAKLHGITVAHMRSQAPILAYLQGLVDRRGILQIPPGTDILGDQTGRWLRLGNALLTLQDPRARKAMEKILSPKNLAKGDWLAVRTKTHPWTLVQIKSVKEGVITLHWRTRAKRGHHDYNTTPQKVSLALQEIHWVPWDKLAPDVVALLLDDRAWKKEHPELVPLLAQWERIQKMPKVNDTRIEVRR